MAFRLARDAKLVGFTTTDGVALEGRLRGAAADRAVILCHPHPLHGGSMLTPVILTAEQAFQEAGHTTLAFNFRGVGGSAGAHGAGEAEIADVEGAIGFVAQTLGAPVATQTVAGYSFGSWVGGRVAVSDARVAAYLGIAPPLAHSDFGFLREARCRVALIAGRRDEHGDAARLEALVAGLPRRPWLRWLDTDHFFSGALDTLAAACRDAIRALDAPPS